MLNRRTCILAALAAVLGAQAGASLAQGTWPSRPMRFVVPFPPGGSNDILARLFAEHLRASLGQPVVVENKLGAGGNIATEFVAKQPADGHTLLLSANTHLVNAIFFAKLPYDPIGDFQPISLVATLPFVLTVNSKLPATTLKEFIAYVKANPGATFATAGVGTPHHLGAELLKSMAGLEIVQVPYKGAAFLVPALLAGEVTFSIAAINSLLPHYKTGRLRPIAIAAEARTPLLPDVPTVAEAGLPGYAMDVWLGVLVRSGTSRPIVDRLNAEINRIIRDPRIVREKLNPIGLSPGGTTPERYLEIMKEELVKYTKIAKDAGIKPQ